MAISADDFYFRQARPDELSIFVEILECAAEWMVASQHKQWIPGTFRAPKTRGHIEATIAMGNGYFIVQKSSLSTTSSHDDDKIIGTFTLNYTDPFDEMLWKDLVKDWQDAIYIHRLVVEREYKGLGLGPKALEFAEREGLKRGKTMLRLDCMADNKLLKTYYREKAGFKEFDDFYGERVFGRFERPITVTL